MEIGFARQNVRAGRQVVEMKNAKLEKLWSRFLRCCENEAELSAHGIGQSDCLEKGSWELCPNYFKSSAIRRIRALQILSDIRKELEKQGMSEEEFLALQNK